MRFADRVPPRGRVLDVACGNGRHTRMFRKLGHPVTALDRDAFGVMDLADDPLVTIVEADLEDGRPPPFAGDRFSAVVVTDYLHRPLLPTLVDVCDAVLIYETFARGQEAHGRPRNPDWLLAPGELLEAVRGHLRVIAYEDIADRRRDGTTALRQRVCAVREQ